jgi:hypothetical protein
LDQFHYDVGSELLPQFLDTRVDMSALGCDVFGRQAIQSIRHYIQAHTIIVRHMKISFFTQHFIKNGLDDFFHVIDQLHVAIVQDCPRKNPE